MAISTIGDLTMQFYQKMQPKNSN